MAENLTVDKSQQKQIFDYNSLEPDTSNFLEQTTKEIKSLLKVTVESVVKIGERLLAVKQKINFGYFLVWIRAEFEWSEDTAERFMNVAKNFGERVKQNPQFAESIGLTVLYELSTKNTPESAREELFARIERGEPISFKQAKALKKAHIAAKKNEQLPASDVEPKTPNEVISIVQPSETSQPPEPVINWWNLTGTFAIEESLGEANSQKKTDQKWKFQANHLLFCGRADRAEFQQRLPQEVALWLDFAPSSHQWKTIPIPPQVRFALSFTTGEKFDLGKIHLKNWLESVEEALHVMLGCFAPGDILVFSYLPYPHLLELINLYELNCLIAEPDRKSCQRIITTWSEIIHGTSQPMQRQMLENVERDFYAAVG
ncbi:hypothetical protein STA3757_27120 [Stanieria sp. NIES-3757]|nr:hypothetical protein STA3757_27120 [Stanieria sp. NIES-3757]